MNIRSEQFTVGNTIIYTVKYGKWLDNTATIVSFTAVGNSGDYTVSGATVLGKEGKFTVAGGKVNSVLTVTITMTDSFGNVKIDTMTLTGANP